jgi:hypothetical protein
MKLPVLLFYVIWLFMHPLARQGCFIAFYYEGNEFVRHSRPPSFLLALFRIECLVFVKGVIMDKITTRL